MLAICLLLLFVIQHTGIRATLIIPGIIAFIVLGAYPNILEIANKKTFIYSSENNGLRFAIDKMAVQYHHLVSTDTAGNRTRPRIYIHALRIINNEPWIGSGVGSY